MQKRKTIFFTKYALVIPSIVVLLLVTLFPFFYTLNISLHKVAGRNLRGAWDWAGLNNFSSALNNEVLWNSVIRTVEFLVLVILIELILGFSLALLFNSDNGILRFLRGILLTPMVITPVVVGLMWKALYKYDGGMVNRALSVFGVPPQPWLTSQPLPFIAKIPIIGNFLVNTLNAKYSFLALVFVDVWQWTPFVMLILLSGLQSIPKDILEAAEVDGANYWQKLTHIIIHLISPAIQVTILLRTIDALKVFDTVYALFGSAADQRLLNVHIMNLALRIRNYGQGAAISVLVLLVIASLSQWFVKIYQRNSESEQSAS
jgi:multiple sugar transport system permease protein